MGTLLDAYYGKNKKKNTNQQSGAKNTGGSLLESYRKKYGIQQSVAADQYTNPVRQYYERRAVRDQTAATPTKDVGALAKTFTGYEEDFLEYQKRIQDLEYLDEAEQKEYAQLVQNYLTSGSELFTTENGFTEDVVDTWQTAQAKAATSAARTADAYESFSSKAEFEHWKNMDTVEKRKEWYNTTTTRISEIDNQLDAGGLSKEEKKALKKERSNLESEIKLYETGQKNKQGFSYGYKVADDYSGLTLNPDFAEKSKPTIDFSAESEDAEFDPDIYAETGTPLFQQDPLGYYLATNRGEVKGSAEIDARAKEGSWDMLEQPEIDIYYYIMNTQGVGAAEQYLYDMKVELNRRQTYADTTEWAQKYKEGNIAKKIGMNAVSVPANVFGAVPGFVENIGSWVRGEAINPYTGGQKGMHYTNTVRDLTGSAIDEATGDKSFLGIKASDIYQTGMSRADSMLATTLLGGTAGSAVLGMGAAQNKAYDLYQKGADDNQILIASVAAGAAEMAWEKISYGKLKELGGGNFAANMAIQGYNEFIEEAGTEITDIITDAVVMGRESEISELLEENNGDWGETALTLLGRVWKAGVGGFLGGAGASVTQTAQANVGTQIYNHNVGTDIKSADGGVAALQSMAQEKAKAIGEIDKRQSRRLMRQAGNISDNSSARKVGALYNSMLTASDTQNFAADQADVAKSLKRSGIEEGLADELAAALVAQYNGTSSEAQNDLIDSLAEDPDMHRAMRDIMHNEKSTFGQRRQDVRDFVASVKEGRFPTKQTAKAVSANEATQASQTSAVDIAADKGTFLKSNNETVESVRISKIDGKNVSVTVNGNTQTSLDDVSWAQESTALAYQAVTETSGMTPAAANMILSNPKASSSAFLRQALDTFTAGIQGTEIQASLDTDVISSDEALALYLEGLKTVKAKEDAIYNAYQRAKGILAKTGKKAHSGSFKISDGVDVTKFDSRQAASAKLAAEMSAALGVDIVLYQDSNPRRFGYYSESADAIFLNVNARWGESVNAKFGEGGASMMAFTLSHELVHRAKVGSPLKFRSFAQFLIREYNKAGVSVDALVAQQIDAAEKAGVPISEDAAFEEVVCDACQRMLTDTDAGKKLAQWGSRSKSNSEFLQTVRDILTELLDNLRRLFKDVTNDSDAARAFQKLDKNVQQILADMFVDMSTDAAEKLSTIKAAGMLDKINTTNEGGVRYKNVIDLSSDNELSKRVGDLHGSSKYKVIQQYILDVLADQPIVLSDGKKAIVDRSDALHIANKSGSKKTAQISSIKKIVETAVLYAQDLNAIHNKFDKFWYYKAVVRFKGEEFPLFVNVGKAKNDGSFHIYDVTEKIRDTADRINGLERPELSKGGALKSDISNESIRNPNEKVKKISTTDSDGNQLTAGQQKYFANSQELDADGHLRVMYRGDSGEVTVYDRKKSKPSNLYGRGFYYTADKSHAGQYGSVRAFYLNAVDPLMPGQHKITKDQMLRFLEAIENDGEDYDLYNYGEGATAQSVLETVWGKGDFEMLQDVSASAIGDLVAAVELFNKINGTTYDSIRLPTETVIFNSNQAKLTTNKNPTGNPDIRYKVSADEDAAYMRAVNSWDKETEQKLVDEAAVDAGAILDEDGKPLKLYRGTLGGQTTFAKGDTYGGKIYTIDNINVATRYGDKSGEATEIRHQTEGEKTTYALYGFPKKMMTIDAQYGVWSDLAIPEELLKYADGRYKATNAEIADWAEQEGYDALRIDNVRDGSFDHGTEIIFFNENAVKSADPVTYGNDGNVIPLSERFNPEKNDIRHKISGSEDLSDAAILSRVSGENITPGQKHNLQLYRERLAKVEEQKEAVKKARDELADVRESNNPKKDAKITKLRVEVQKEVNRLKIYEKKLDAVVNSAPIRELLSKEREAAEIRDKESIDRILSQMRGKYGTIPAGEKAVRDDSLPVSTNDNNRVSRAARTVKGAAVTTDEMAQIVDQEVANGRLTYIPITNEDTAAKANAWVKNLGWASAKFKWYSDVDKGKTGADIAARGAVLLNNAAQAGDVETWRELLFQYQKLSTNTAQGLQAMRILKQLEPTDKLWMATQSVDQMVADMRLKVDIEIDPDLQKEFLSAETDEQRDEIIDKIQKDVASHIPSTLIDKFNALRYLNMLGNLRTQVRNLLGNFTMQTLNEVKNVIATSIQQIIYLASGKTYKKNRAIFASKKLIGQTYADYSNVKSLLLSGARYSSETAESSEFARKVNEYRRIFWKTPLDLLERYRKLTNKATDFGDLFFSKFAFVMAEARFLKARGIKDINDASPELLDEARAFAVAEAQEQTFRDTNWLSGWVTKIDRRPDTPAIGKAFGEGVAPFRKTPANILVRAVEYSPAGIVVSSVKTAQKLLKDPNVTGDQLINSWAKSLTGTGLFVLGAWLSAVGVLSGGASDDEDKDKFDKMYGQQNFALTIGKKNYTFDWMSPAAISILMGAQFNEIRQEGNVEWKDMESAITSLGEPMIEMSMLQGVKDVLDNVQYAKSNLGQMVVNVSLSYLTQGLGNSLVGQIERSFEKNRETTYVDNDSAIPAWLQRTIGQFSNKVPGWDYNQIPYINAWGEEEETPNVAGNAWRNMVSPSYSDEFEKDAVYDELVRLNEAQDDKNVFPNTPSKTYKDPDDDEAVKRNLTAEEYVALAKAQGTTQRKLVEKMISNPTYKRMKDTDKAKAISFAYTYAKEKAQIDVLGRKDFSDKWMSAIGGGDPVYAILAHVNEY